MKTHTLEAHQFVESILTRDFCSSQHHSIKNKPTETSKPSYNFWSFHIIIPDDEDSRNNPDDCCGYFIGCNKYHGDQAILWLWERCQVLH